ncbi:MAG: DotI/IcmL family type IV secretion protein [Azoarcus sp.]|jgi:intracellular multiplication protein IcmL|nr:DotI/IcmL family type IV secretion protein [Azoarcus sp.]
MSQDQTIDTTPDEGSGAETGSENFVMTNPGDVTSDSSRGDAQTDVYTLAQTDNQTEGEAASTLRENADLRSAIADLRSRHKKVWTAVTVQGVLLFFVVFGVVLVYPKYRYIPTLDNLAICEVGTEINPRVTSEVLTEFAKDAAIDLYTYSFVDWREKINASINKWMTDDGRIGFLDGLESTGNLERVRKGRLIVKAMAQGVPQLEEKGQDGLSRYWIVRVPIVLEFYTGQTDKPATSQHYIAAVKITEVPPTARNVKGIAVQQLVLAHAMHLR